MLKEETFNKNLYPENLSESKMKYIHKKIKTEIICCYLTHPTRNNKVLQMKRNPKNNLNTHTRTHTQWQILKISKVNQTCNQVSEKENQRKQQILNNTRKKSWNIKICKTTYWRYTPLIWKINSKQPRHIEQTTKEKKKNPLNM